MVRGLLSARQLVVVLGKNRALDGLDLDVQPRSVYALLGPNGAGKTTLLNTLLGFIAPSGGDVSVGGASPASQAADVRRLLAYLPEQVALYPYLSGVENLCYFCALAGRRLTASVAKDLLVQAGVAPDAVSRRVEGYSKGMRQKVGIAIAHAKQAKALLLDEPTSGLDPSATAELTQRLRDCAASGMAVLMVTHDLLNAREVSDRIGILQAGRRVAEFDAKSIDASELTRRYIAHATP